MVLFNVLSPKQPLFSPEVPISGMLIPFDQQQSRWNDTFRVDELSGGSDRLVFTALNTILRHMFQDPASFQTATTFALASSSQTALPPNSNNS
jgi:hypothetical protein